MTFTNGVGRLGSGLDVIFLGRTQAAQLASKALTALQKTKRGQRLVLSC